MPETILNESNLVFRFPDGTKAIKFDDESFYRNQFNVLPYTKGVDFLSVDSERLCFIEVKNCAGDEANNRWRIFPDNKKRDTANTSNDVSDRDSLDIEIPGKVSLTLSALAGKSSFANGVVETDALSEMAQEILQEISKDCTEAPLSKRKILVILLLEGEFQTKTRTKKMIMTALQSSIEKKLKWLNCVVSVEDSNTYRPNIFSLESPTT